MVDSEYVISLECRLSNKNVHARLFLRLSPLSEIKSAALSAQDIAPPPYLFVKLSHLGGV